MSGLQDKTEAELAEICVNYNDTSPQPVLAKQELQRKLINEQHKLNKENILLQHSLNTQIVEQQLKLMKITTFVTAASTLIAAIAGAYLAYALTQTQKPIQIKLDSGQLSQIQTALSNANKPLNSLNRNKNIKGE